MISITIYGKVPSKSSGRQIIINRRTGRPMVISSQETRQYEKDFAAQVTGAHRFHAYPAGTRLNVVIVWYTDSYRQDIDAPAKAIFDNLQKAAVIENDNKIDDYHIIRFIDKDNPRAEIFIKEHGKW